MSLDSILTSHVKKLPGIYLVLFKGCFSDPPRGSRPNKLKPSRNQVIKRYCDFKKNLHAADQGEPVPTAICLIQ